MTLLLLVAVPLDRQTLAKENEFMYVRILTIFVKFKLLLCFFTYVLLHIFEHFPEHLGSERVRAAVVRRGRGKRVGIVERRLLLLHLLVLKLLLLLLLLLRLDEELLLLLLVELVGLEGYDGRELERVNGARGERDRE